MLTAKKSSDNVMDKTLPGFSHENDQRQHKKDSDALHLKNKNQINHKHLACLCHALIEQRKMKNSLSPHKKVNKLLSKCGNRSVWDPQVVNVCRSRLFIASNKCTYSLFMRFEKQEAHASHGSVTDILNLKKPFL